MGSPLTDQLPTLPADWVTVEIGASPAVTVTVTPGAG